MFDHCIHVLSLLQWKQVQVETKRISSSFFYSISLLLVFFNAKTFSVEWPPKNGSPPQGAKEPLRNFCGLYLNNTYRLSDLNLEY